MLKYNLYQIKRIFTLSLISIMPYFMVAHSFAQPKSSMSENDRFASEMFQYLASQVALQRGDIALSYQTMFNLAKNTRDPRIAQNAMEIALAAPS